MAEEVKSGNVDSIFDIRDISYATGFLVEWDFFLHQIFHVASLVSYMTAIGNYERYTQNCSCKSWTCKIWAAMYVCKYIMSFIVISRDYLDSGSVYVTPHPGGECGVPYETYFPMPTPAKDKPWYFIEQGCVHFTVMSTEHS